MSVVTHNRFKLFLLLIGVGGVMVTANSSSATTFRLKTPEFYFQGDQELALLRSALNGDLPLAKQLVADGANPNADGPVSNPYNRLRLLHYAIAANSPIAVQTLLSIGADPELSVAGFGRALLFAITLERFEMLSLLLDLRPINTLGRDTIEYLIFESVTQGCTQCLKILLDREAPVDFRDEAGYTALLRAMDAQDYEMAEWLLLQGASVHVVPASGVTPAYSVEFHLKKFKPESPTYNKVLHLKDLMAERGAVFPAQTPAEVRARRDKF